MQTCLHTTLLHTFPPHVNLVCFVLGAQEAGGQEAGVEGADFEDVDETKCMPPSDSIDDFETEAGEEDGPVDAASKRQKRKSNLEEAGEDEETARTHDAATAAKSRSAPAGTSSKHEELLRERKRQLGSTMQEVLCEDRHTVIPSLRGIYPPFCNYPLCQCPVLITTGGRRAGRGGSTAGLDQSHEQQRRVSRRGQVRGASPVAPAAGADAGAGAGAVDTAVGELRVGRSVRVFYADDGNWCPARPPRRLRAA